MFSFKCISVYFDKIFLLPTFPPLRMLRHPATSPRRWSSAVGRWLEHSPSVTDVAAAPARAHRALARARAHRPRDAHGALSREPALGEAGALEPGGERLSPAPRSSPRPARPPEVWPLSPRPRSGTSSGRGPRCRALRGRTEAVCGRCAPVAVSGPCPCYPNRT